ADFRRCLVERVERGVQRINPLELERLSTGETGRFRHLSALDELGEDAERRWPASHADGCARLGERLGDGEPEAAIIGDAGDESTLSGEVDAEHAGESSIMVAGNIAARRPTERLLGAENF